MSDDGERQRYDLGVLFVHGIGQQARGQTLTAWADPVIRWLQLWLRHEPEPGAEPEPDPVEVGAAELGPVPEDPAAPAQVELRVVAAGRADGQPAARRWLLAEAWWAEAFTLPRFRELAVWGFAVLPWTLVAHFAAHLQRAWRGPRVVARVARVLWQALGLLLAVLLFPLLAVGVLVVGPCAGSGPASAGWPASSPSARARPSWWTWRASATPTPPGRSGWPRPGWWPWPPASGCCSATSAAPAASPPTTGRGWGRCGSPSWGWGSCSSASPPPGRDGSRTPSSWTWAPSAAGWTCTPPTTRWPTGPCSTCPRRPASGCR